jgi:co-chaperonin GroES (HSP10)
MENVGELRPLHDSIIITDMEFGEERTTSGLYIPSQNGKVEGIKPRWGQVYAVGPDQTDIKVGDWICVEHGRWTRGIEIQDQSGNKITIRKVDNDCILLVSDVQPSDINLPA